MQRITKNDEPIAIVGLFEFICQVGSKQNADLGKSISEVCLVYTGPAAGVLPRSPFAGTIWFDLCGLEEELHTKLQLTRCRGGTRNYPHVWWNNEVTCRISRREHVNAFGSGIGEVGPI